ncbi:MAG: RimK family protein [Candidatus Woesearchaeota archaeon]
MQTLIITDKPKNWPLQLKGVKLVGAKDYLLDQKYDHMYKARVFNICRSYSYQTYGYYVSLIAAARGHKPIPSIATIQELKNVSIVKIVSEEMEETMQKALARIESDRFTLSIYFGKNLATKYDHLSRQIYNSFQSPFLKAEFKKRDKWFLQSVRAISANEIPEAHLDFVLKTAKQYFSSKRFVTHTREHAQYDLAILFNPQEENPPSDEKAIQKFIDAGHKIGINSYVIHKEDYADIAQYDALFIRETTSVNHHTYRFARKAMAEGLIVIDHPDSIEKCANKVFLAELLRRYNIPHPNTLIVHKANRAEVVSKIGLPCVLKQPDSAFSLGVFKAETEEKLNEYLDLLLKQSDLIIAQEFLPTEFDWRVVVLDKQPLTVCKYHMAKKHWQIQRNEPGKTEYGKVEAFDVAEVPTKVVNTAIKIANAIGDGFYGVDIKEKDGKIYVIEVNDNPNIEAGYEDKFLKDTLYLKIMRYFQRKIDEQKEKNRK